MNKAINMTPPDMAWLKEIINHQSTDLGYLRDRLDKHITNEEAEFKQIQRDISNIRETLSGHKIKFSMIAAGVAGIISLVVAYFTNTEI